MNIRLLTEQEMIKILHLENRYISYSGDLIDYKMVRDARDKKTAAIKDAEYKERTDKLLEYLKNSKQAALKVTEAYKGGDNMHFYLWVGTWVCLKELIDSIEKDELILMTDEQLSEHLKEIGQSI